MKLINFIIIAIVALLLLGCNSEPNPAKQNSGSSGASAEFLNMAGAKSQATYQVTYELQTTFQGQPSRKAVQSLYVKDGKARRHDTITEQAEIRYYMNGDTFTLCSKKDGAWECYSVSNFPQNDADKNEKSIQANPEKYKISNDGTMNIAGVTAKCFRASGISGSEVSIKVCYSNEGVGLY